MFEVSLEDTTATIFINEFDARMLGEQGFSFDLSQGGNRLNYKDAAALVSRMYKAIPNIRYAKNVKRFTSIINQIIFAFGPEFEAIHKRINAK